MNKLTCNFIIILCVFVLITACGTMRSEFYREESRHLYDQALTEYRLGDYVKASKSFKKVLQLDPEYGQVYANLGHIALAEQSFSEAEEMYQQAIKLNPELEEDLLLFLLAAKEGESRAPLTDCGFDLNEVLQLLEAANSKELEEKLNNPTLPLSLLAKDYSSIRFNKLKKLNILIQKEARKDNGSVRYKLFLVYYLYYSHIDDNLALHLMEPLTSSLEQMDQQKAYEILGFLYERTGNQNRAISTWLSAVEAGTPLAKVAPMLAKIYRVSNEAILAESSTPIQVSIQTQNQPSFQILGTPQSEDIQIVHPHPE